MASCAATTGVKVVKFESQLNKAVARNIKLEAYTRRSNLTFYGVDEFQTEDTEKEVRKVLAENLKMPKPKVDTLRFERVHRIKTREANSSKQRPIIARFSFYQEKREVFSFTKNLKHTGISIGDDYPVEINKTSTRRKLLPVLKAAKREKKKAFFKVDKLIIDNSIYRGEETKGLPFYGNIM